MIAAHYEAREYSRAMREIMRLADAANQYIDERKPWVLAKQGQSTEVQRVCTTGLNLFRALMLYLTPVLPATAAKAGEFLCCECNHWSAAAEPLLSIKINKFKPLLTRIEASQVDNLVAASTEAEADTQHPENDTEPAEEDMISIDEFAKVDLRVATVLKAEAIEAADKLLKITVDDGTRERTIMAGIKSAYNPESLVGRQVVIVANLKPRAMRFGTSEGMILAAGDEDVFLLSADTGAKAGMKVS